MDIIFSKELKPVYNGQVGWEENKYWIFESSVASSKSKPVDADHETVEEISTNTADLGGMEDVIGQLDSTG